MPNSITDGPRPAPLWQPAITIGFATAVAMWLVGFVTHLPGIRVSPAIVGAAMLLIWFAGAFVGGRLTAPRSVTTGIAAGIVTALVNLLILGSLLSTGEGPNDLRPNWAILLAGYFIFAAVIGAVGGALGAASVAGRTTSTIPSSNHWLARFAWVGVFAVVPVIFSGGLVTSAKAGLAVPDWPNSFSSNMFLYPLARMTGGIYYEHAHRLFGSLVGLTTLTMLLFTLIVERRTWAKFLIAGVFALVCLQGALGGWRVIAATATSDELHAPTADNALSLPLAMVHGISGQLTFALLCVAAAVMSLRWRSLDDASHDSHLHTRITDNALRTFTTAAIITVILQLCLGAASRHFQHLHALYSHAGFAVFVLVTAAFASFRAMKWTDHPPLRTLGREVLHAVVAQIALGLAALFLVLPYDGHAKQGAAFLLATLHQLNGAVILGLTAALWAWTRRLTIK